METVCNIPSLLLKSTRCSFYCCKCIHAKGLSSRKYTKAKGVRKIRMKIGETTKDNCGDDRKERKKKGKGGLGRDRLENEK